MNDDDFTKLVNDMPDDPEAVMALLDEINSSIPTHTKLQALCGMIEHILQETLGEDVRFCLVFVSAKTKQLQRIGNATLEDQNKLMDLAVKVYNRKMAEDAKEDASDD